MRDKDKKVPTVKIILLFLLVMLLAIVMIVRFVVLNKKYPNPTVITYQQGEKIKGGDIEIMVKKSEIVSMDTILGLAPAIQNQIRDAKGNLLDDNQKKVLLVDLEISNTGDKKQEMSFIQLVVQSNAWSNGIDMETYNELNKTRENLISLEPGGKKEITLPFYLYDIQFTGDNFRKAEKRNYQLILSRYPVKNEVELKVVPDEVSGK